MSEDKNKNSSIVLATILLSFAIILITSSLNIAVIDPNSEFGIKSYYEKNLKDGNIYIASGEYILGGGSTIYISGITEANPIEMYQRKIQATSSTDIEISIKLYEDGEFITGTPQENFNKNREFLDNSTFSIYSSGTTGSSIIGATLLPFSNELKGEKKVTLSTTEFADYIMKKNTTYILSIENKNPQQAKIIFNWNWIESN